MKTLVCTVIIGERRAYQAERLAASVAEFTDFDTVIYHDKTTPIEYDNTVLLNDHFHVHYKISGMFNFNLKGMVIKDAYDRFPDYDRYIFLDADIVIWRKTDLFKYMESEDFYGTIRLFGEGHLNSQSQRKWERLIHIFDGDIETPFEGMPYVTETIFVLKRGEAVTQFLDLWSYICYVSSLNYVNPSFECVELGMAMYLTPQMSTVNICGSPFKKNDCLKTEHRNEFQPVIAR